MKTEAPQTNVVWLPSKGLNERRATRHTYDHSEVITIAGSKSVPAVQGLAHFYKCSETGELRRYGFDATFRELMLVALDSGLRSPGIAIFDELGLRAAGNIEIGDLWMNEQPGERWRNVGNEIVAWLVNMGVLTPPDEFVFEKPQWYGPRSSKADPNDLVGMAGVAANVTGRLQPRAIKSPVPAEWIGQISKICPVCDGRKTKTVRGKRVPFECQQCNGSAWLTPRGRYISSRLLSTEIYKCPDQNDAIDAVGLGLWALGRLEPRRVFSNGRDGR